MADLTPTPTPNLEDENVENTESRRPSVLLWSIIVLVAFALGLSAGYFIWARPLEARAVAAEQKLIIGQKTAEANTANQNSGADQQNVPQQVKRYNVTTGDNPIFGSDKATITLIEFSDYQCPYCKQWHQQVWPLIQAKYGDKVRFVYRDFPLSTIHPEATSAAEAADCAGEQKKYYEFGDLLFGGGKELGSEAYTAYAQQLGLNVTDFNKCIQDRKYQKEVESDFNFASELGVRSTPTFFVNGLAIVGAQPFEVFQQVIDLELDGKIPK